MERFFGVKNLIKLLLLSLSVIVSLCTSLWLGLYLYIFMGSVLHGEDRSFFDIIAKEYSPHMLTGAAILLALSIIVFRFAWTIK